jgi:indole-3-glycerol phosphate synthase
MIPDSVTKVAESGISGPDDAAVFAALGAAVVLVGEALVKGGDPTASIRAMRSVPA